MDMLNSGLDTLDMFIEFLESGRPGTKVVVAEFKEGTYKEDVAKAGRQLRDCQYTISAYLDRSIVGVLVREDMVEAVKNVAEKKCNASAKYHVYSPEEFLAMQKDASKP